MLFVALSFAIFMDIIFAVAMFLNTTRFIAHSRPVSAKITKLDLKNGTAKAHVLFKELSGKSVETSTVIPLNKYNEGDTIELLYHNDNTENVKINTQSSLWILPRIMFASAAIFSTLLAVIVYLGIAKMPL